MSEHYNNGQIRLLHGDATEQVATLDAGSVQTVVTSPPHFGLRDYGEAEQYGAEATVAEYIDRLVDLFREVRRALSDDGTVWLNLGDSYSTYRPVKNLFGIPWRVALALQDDGWVLRSDIIWHKPNPMPEAVTDRPTRSHEYVFLLAKSARYFYDAEAIKRTVWTVPTVASAGAHFATFPPALVRPCILAGTRPGDVVLDPFSGSGTTGMVALEQGRKYVGVDLNADYLDLSLRERFAEQPLDIFGEAS